MAAPVRSDEQHEEDLVRVAAMYVRGSTQAEISKVVGVTRQQVGYDLRIIRKRWLESQIRDFDELKSRELEKLDELERTAWSAWERSLAVQEKSATERISKESGDETRVRLEKLTRTGEPRFLEIVLKCIQKRAEICGLDAPVKIAPTTPDGAEPFKLAIGEMSDEELTLVERILERQRSAARVSGIAGPGAGADRN